MTVKNQKKTTQNSIFFFKKYLYDQDCEKTCKDIYYLSNHVAKCYFKFINYNGVFFSFVVQASCIDMNGRGRGRQLTRILRERQKGLMSCSYSYFFFFWHLHAKHNVNKVTVDIPYVEAHTSIDMRFFLCFLVF